MRGAGRPANIPLDLRNYHDLEKRSIHLYQVIGESQLTEYIRWIVFWHDGRIDGGDMDGCYPAMDYADPTTCDGGAL